MILGHIHIWSTCNCAKVFSQKKDKIIDSILLAFSIAG